MGGSNDFLQVRSSFSIRFDLKCLIVFFGAAAEKETQKVDEGRFRISRDTPALYLTAVTKDRLPVFRTDAICSIACSALCEARVSGDFALLAYVLMPDHIHLITDSKHKPSHILRYVNGITSRRIIGYLKEQGFVRSLDKLRHNAWRRRHAFSLWGDNSNAMSLTSESALMQKVNYIHQNPVRAGLVERAVDYRWSSARCWARCELEDEPVRVDIEKIIWRRSRR